MILVNLLSERGVQTSHFTEICYRIIEKLEGASKPTESNSLLRAGIQDKVYLLCEVKPPCLSPLLQSV